MSEAAIVNVRPSARDLRDIPLDSDTAMRARLTLTPRELGVWFNLRTHLWLFGDLPVSIRALAKVGGVGAKSFERMMPLLSPLFDHDTAGRWRDLDLEEERATRIDLSPADDGERSEIGRGDRGIDPGLSEARRRAGRAGAARRWDNAQRLTVVDGGRTSDNLSPSSMPAELVDAVTYRSAAPTMAKSMANESSAPMANEPDLPSGFVATVPSFATGFAMAGDRPRGQLASLLESSFSEEIQEQAGKLAARADAMASDLAKPPAVSDETMANPMAKPPSEADPAAADAATKPDDATMVDAIVRIGQGKITKAEAVGRLQVFRETMADGVDFMLDIVPTIERFARNKPHVDNCANRHVLADARLHARNRRKAAALPEPPSVGASNVVKIYVDEPENKDRVATYLRVTGKKSLSWRHDGRGRYYWFSTAAWHEAGSG